MIAHPNRGRHNIIESKSLPDSTIFGRPPAMNCRDTPECLNGSEWKRVNHDRISTRSKTANPKNETPKPRLLVQQIGEKHYDHANKTEDFGAVQRAYSPIGTR